MTRAITAAWPLQVAVDTRLLADATVAALIAQRAYAGEPPEGGAALPYVVYGDASEAERALCGEPGAAGVLTLHLWTASQRGVHALYDAVHGALADAVLTLTLSDGSTAQVSLDLTLLNVLRDPDTTTTLYHAPVACRWWAVGTP